MITLTPTREQVREAKTATRCAQGEQVGFTVIRDTVTVHNPALAVHVLTKLGDALRKEPAIGQMCGELEDYLETRRERSRCAYDLAFSVALAAGIDAPAETY